MAMEPMGWGLMLEGQRFLVPAAVILPNLQHWPKSFLLGCSSLRQTLGPESCRCTGATQGGPWS